MLTTETTYALDEYLRFRHVVRNVYAFQLKAEKIMPLVAQLHRTYERLRVDLEKFVRFLHYISKVDELD